MKTFRNDLNWLYRDKTLLVGYAFFKIEQGSVKIIVLSDRAICRVSLS